ncbi:hypothetical protein BC829DRAFT_440295 [Chytridium lagenaria]|nr:hypothetical protein BC829DRAFT_440295 [Chytridium lagenaria]
MNSARARRFNRRHPPQQHPQNLTVPMASSLRPTISTSPSLSSSPAASLYSTLHNTSSLRLSLINYKDPTRKDPSASFDPIEKQMGEGHILKIGRQVKPTSGDLAATNPVVDEPSPTTPNTESPVVLLSTAMASLTLRGATAGATGAGVSEQGSNAAPTPVDAPSSPLMGVTEKLPPLPGKVVEHAWFKSKVVSRNHAELWMRDGQIYLRDTGSSSGTFLNRMRLSPSGKLSRPYPLKDGDLIQLGIDYQGRPEGSFRNALKALLTASNPYATTAPKPTIADIAPTTSTPTAPSNSAIDCCICLNTIGPYQALFISPCSHCYHHKCVRNLLDTAMFQCPMCRQVANLDASVSMESLVGEAAEEEAGWAVAVDEEGEERAPGDVSGGDLANSRMGGETARWGGFRSLLNLKRKKKDGESESRENVSGSATGPNGNVARSTTVYHNPERRIDNGFSRAYSLFYL